MVEDFGASPSPAPTGTKARAIGWQEAVARLMAERGRAETGVALLKKHGDEAARSRGELAYGEGRAEVDAIVSGLIVALAQGTEPTSLPELEARLECLGRVGAAFGALVRSVVPDGIGERGWLADLAGGLLGGTVGPVADAVKAIRLDTAQARREADRLKAKTIETQLEAARWPVFAAIPCAA
jgi:hypothetical protein